MAGAARLTRWALHKKRIRAMHFLCRTKIRSLDRIDSSAVNSIGPIRVIDYVTVRMGCACLEVIEMNADRDVLLVLIPALSIPLVSVGDQPLEDGRLRCALEIIRRWTRDGSGLVGVRCGLIGFSLVSRLIVICGFRVCSLHSANPLLINKTMPEFTTVFIHLDDKAAKVIFRVVQPDDCSFAPVRRVLGMRAPATK
ncbi:MAG: hypothetical protein DMF66_19185 [Acidobacteria bacterium]|nr:MAG: hypothetical protein DMF66_19185 [Acidobacteriota bacterium]